MIPYSLHSIGNEEIQAVTEVMRSGCLTGGPKGAQFEREFAEYIGAKEAVAVNSCASALYLAIKALFPDRGTIIAIPTLTYVATANAVLLAGHIPRLVDVDPETFCIDPAKIPKEAEAVIPVHYAGHPCDLDAIRQVGNWIIIEDAAHACGSEYKGQKIGAINTTCFSFHPCKNMTTAEGGMITTDSPELAKRLRRMRLNGIEKNGINQAMVEWGFKFNVNEISAAIGIEQLKKLDAMNKRRKETAYKYDCAFYGGFQNQPNPHNEGNHSHHLYPILINDRDKLAEYLRSKGIVTAIHYRPIHLMPYYQSILRYKEGSFPVAESIAKRILSIPIYPDMTDEQVDYVIQMIKEGIK